MPENYFDERIAKGYEARWPNLFEPAVIDPAVSFLADLAGTGAALELGIGTGRIALPLSRRGVRVHGIELSPDMVAQLQAKPQCHLVQRDRVSGADAVVSGESGRAGDGE